MFALLPVALHKKACHYLPCMFMHEYATQCSLQLTWCQQALLQQQQLAAYIKL
jgi:hypothetical protein